MLGQAPGRFNPASSQGTIQFNWAIVESFESDNTVHVAIMSGETNGGWIGDPTNLALPCGLRDLNRLGIRFSKDGVWERYKEITCPKCAQFIKFLLDAIETRM